MVSYCCVKGCNSSSRRKKKDPNSVISFHAFPSNQELKQKWLRAIGRPNWTPSSYTRICSIHFSHDHINYDGCRIRMKGDAIPVNRLPPNSNFEASDVEVCRICLATDLKMYNLQDSQLGTYMDSILGFSENHNLEGLPQYVCYQCAAYVLKCYKLVEKSMVAQTTLLDIFAQNGKITKDLIKQQDRDKLNLKSTLSSTYLNVNSSQYTATESEDNTDMCFKNEKDFIYEGNARNMDVVKKEIEDSEITILNSDNNESNVVVTTEINNPCDELDSEDFRMSTPLQDARTDNDSDFEENLKLNILKNKDNVGKLKPVRKKVKKRRDKGLTPDETDMKKYFDIVKLSLQEQIEEWQKMATRRLTGEMVYKCKTCHKIFAHENTYSTHITNHEPSRGKSECPVCKLRFKNDVLMKSHSHRAHEKKFFCKACPKIFNNVSVAKKHQRWHSGYTYKCSLCSFSSAHECALGVHMRTRHAHAHACVHCGRAFVSSRGLKLHRATAHRNITETDSTYRCEECDINFTSEGARRVHLLTSSQHKNNPDLCDASGQDPSLQNACRKCGANFSSFTKLILHTRTEHPRPTKKSTSLLSNGSYPMQCELCGETVSSRKKHWWHVRRHHPKETDAYQPVITTICDVCGKGFQNAKKLQLHQLRHGSPTVRCAGCARMFYDKHALARHAATHSAAKPHNCRICGRAFKRRTNLDRHARVHTDATPYECRMCDKKFKHSSSVNLHIRTVHYKLSHPPRKKRTRSVREAIDDVPDI